MLQFYDFARFHFDPRIPFQARKRFAAILAQACKIAVSKFPSIFRKDNRAHPATTEADQAFRHARQEGHAAAVRTAAPRPAVRFVPAAAERQSVLMLHRARALLGRRRAMPARACPAKVARRV
ncbi:MAG: hypothetical protein ACREDH_10385 [Methylocella sp.]